MAAVFQGMSLVHSVWLWPVHGFDPFEECPKTLYLVIGHWLEMAVMCDFID